MAERNAPDPTAQDKAGRPDREEILAAIRELETCLAELRRQAQQDGKPDPGLDPDHNPDHNGDLTRNLAPNFSPEALQAAQAGLAGLAERLGRLPPPDLFGFAYREAETWTDRDARAAFQSAAFEFLTTLGKIPLEFAHLAASLGNWLFMELELLSRHMDGRLNRYLRLGAPAPGPDGPLDEPLQETARQYQLPEIPPRPNWQEIERFGVNYQHPDYPPPEQSGPDAAPTGRTEPDPAPAPTSPPAAPRREPGGPKESGSTESGPTESRPRPGPATSAVKPFPGPAAARPDPAWSGSGPAPAASHLGPVPGPDAAQPLWLQLAARVGELVRGLAGIRPGLAESAATPGALAPVAPLRGEYALNLSCARAAAPAPKPAPDPGRPYPGQIYPPGPAAAPRLSWLTAGSCADFPGQPPDSPGSYPHAR